VAKWSKKVDELRARVMKLDPGTYMAEVGTVPMAPVQASDRMDGVEAPSVVSKKSKAKAKVKAKGEVERGAIRLYCEELLLRSKGVDEATKRPLGLTYEAILEKVQTKFPSAATSVGCLRWYATKMNKRTGKDRVVMPVRGKAVAAA
jgi:hypothetical protein